MIIFKCKMCGGDLEFEQGASVAECPYCGTTQTLPKLDNDKRANMYDRANHFRRQNEYDKAMAIYEQILQEDRTDAEAYWSLVLCRYGIEYVEDPVSHKRIPTVNRMQYVSVLADEDYKSALKYADAAQHKVYETEANVIAEIQKGILEISKQEQPFDVFICYKETDVNGRRTKDSMLAQEIYYQLTNDGYKVFFSRITLEDKLGQEYEPYIFAALNSAKVMLVVGTSAENFNAVWVKNEWSRFLALMKNDRKKLLIPCYRDMDPYDLPEELSMLQSQDMGKIGFIQDINRGVKKVLDADKKNKQPNPGSVFTTGAAPSITSFLMRAQMFLEDGDWESAGKYAEKILDIDPKCAQAYIVKLCVRKKVRNEADLISCDRPLDDDADYRKAIRFADDKHKEVYSGYNETIKERIALADQCKKAEDIWFGTKGELGNINAEREVAIEKYEALKKETALIEFELSNQRGIFKGKQKKQLQDKITANNEVIKSASSQIESIDARYNQQLKVVEAAEKDYNEYVYLYAQALCDAKLYNDACTQYRKIPGYKDVDEILSDVEGKTEKNAADVSITEYSELQTTVNQEIQSTVENETINSVDEMCDGIDQEPPQQQGKCGEYKSCTEKQTESSIHSFTQELAEIGKAKNGNDMESALSNKASNNRTVNKKEDKIASQKADYIKSFEIPNDIDVILDFLVYATSNIDTAVYSEATELCDNVKAKEQYENRKTVADAWLVQIQQAYQKATVSFTGDPKYKKINNLYKGCVRKINRNRIKASFKKTLWYILMTILLIAGLAFLVYCSKH